jgi:dTDP-4-dehydrorhamnose reductase
MLADITAHAIRLARHEPSLAGTYHAVAAGETSWFEYARFVIEWARAQGRPVKLAPEAIEPVPTTAFPLPAKRPLNSRLSTARLRTQLGLEPPHWQQGVERMLQEISQA